MKVLILILCYDHESVYYTIEKGISKTWNSEIFDEAPTFYYFGNKTSCYHDSSSIFTTCKDSLDLVGVRTIETFEYALSTFEFDYIYRTNISSYVNKEKLISWLKNQRRSNFYSGFVGFFQGIQFASGSGFTISRDLVRLLCDSKDSLDYNLLDDVSFAKFLTGKMGVSITPAPRVEFSSPQQVTTFDLNNFHFRCKSIGDRAGDSITMNLIHNKIKNKK